MGNQLTGEAPVVIYPVEHYLTDLAYYEYDCSLGSTRFFKVARAKCREGLVVVRIFVIQDPTMPLPLKEHQEKLDAIYKSLNGLPNCLPFQKHVKLDRAAILIRQYVKYNLYDRLSTRPFLTLIEKKWIAFQLLCALNQCHKVKVCHGDIKAENILITSWNWVLLTDFASFKPTSLPYDNPADFSYFFDTSRRRVCYIAPERLVGKPPSESNWESGGSGLEESQAPRVYRELTPAMDIFSAGCVITEMFCDGVAPFDLSQLLNYSCKNYSPWKLIEAIPDNSVKELVEQMIQRKPELRLSAEEYLIKQRGKAFPEFFYTFFKAYCQHFSSLLPSDDKILLLNRDMDELLSHMEVDERREKNDKLVLIISLVASVARDLHFSSFRLMALKLFLKLSHHVTADIILDRILPFVLNFAQDPLPEVRAATIRTVTSCVKNLKSVPRNDANVFQDYIIPALSPLLSDDVLQVRLTFAENIAQLADTAVKYLDMAQAQEIREVIVQLKDQQKDKSHISDTVVNVKKSPEELKPEIHQVESNYDTELQQLKDLIHQKIFQLLSDPNHSVKMTLMANGMDKLCLFFGRQKANDILLSHIVTFLNVKDDWRLRACFFKTVVDVTMYVGWQCSEVLLPLLQQGLNDTEEFVITEDLHALKQLTNHRLLNKNMMQTLVCDALPLLAHPGAWVRQAAVGFTTAVAQAYDISDIFCKLVPHVEPFLTRKALQLRRPEVVLDALNSPLSRDMFDCLLRSAQLDSVFEVMAKQAYIRSISRQPRSGYPELDQQLAQVFRKLTSLGLNDKSEEKLLAMKDFLLRLHKNRAGSIEAFHQSPTKSHPGNVNISAFGRNVTRRHADLQKNRDPVAETQSTPSGRKKVKKQESVSMNPEWKKMFGSDDPDPGSLSSSPRSLASTASVLDRTSVDTALQAVASANLPPASPGPSSGASHSESLSQSLLSVDSFQKSVSSAGSGDKSSAQKPVVTRYAKCKWELRDLVHHRRAQFEDDILSTDAISGMAWDAHRPADSWRPKGVLVAHLQEHRAAINRLSVSHDHRLFASCSNDGTVRIWESGKLEGKTAANRSKVSLNKQGGKIKSVAFLERSSAVACASDNNSIKVYRLDSGAVQSDTSISVDHDTYGQIMDMAHFDAGAQSVLTYATVSGHMFGWDLRAPGPAWTLRNDPRDGLITSFAVNQSQSWLAVGTYSSTLVCWDMRFRMPINRIHHPSGRRVRRVAMHPSEQSWLVASFNWHSEVSMWDAETRQRQKTLWPSRSPPLTYTKQNKSQEEEGVCGLYVGSTESKPFVLTGGTDMRLRFWDLSYPAHSVCFSDSMEDARNSFNYRSQLMEGSEVIQEQENQREPLDKSENDREMHTMHSAPPPAHQDTVSDITLCHSTQTLVISAARNGHIKVWK
ncbi:phosphoinositide 3-kinase regulatory subunit 4 [Aplysia californica]|uniref:non-specific serine/threonine protein kinase n=1 Tax=Aplysia californica TaxID=6500 RepID=A0ABM1ABJ8_APLCA|nr:phosphoinositide 3-kinase regulatory subunit 4 [Aplysia californica]